MKKSKVLFLLIGLFGLAITACGGTTSSKKDSSPASSNDSTVTSVISSDSEQSSEESSEESSAEISSSEEISSSIDDSSEASSEQSSESSVEESSESSVSECSKHTWGDWEIVVEPTCVDDGTQRRVCTVCGKTQEKKASATGHNWVADESKTDVPSTCETKGTKYEKCSVCEETREVELALADHSYGEWVVVEATCGEPGTRTRTCSVCNHQEQETFRKLPHSWTVKNTVAKSGEDDMAYDEVECSVCHKTGIWAACENMEINGSDKGGAPEGCIKLASNGQNMTAKINLPEAKEGTLYLRGAMDYWHDGNNDNQNKTFSSCKNNNPANFSFSVNGTNLDFSDKYSVTFGEMLPEEAGETVGGTTYSQIGDCEVSAISLDAGENTLVFTRVDSYNLAIKYFLIVFNDASVPVEAPVPVE